MAVQQTILPRTVPNWPILVKDLKLNPGDKVLDSGTGEGSFLLEASASIPNASEIEFHGVDITDAKFPDPKLLPPNVHLSLHSIRSLPDEWANWFAFVHQTFFIVSLRGDEWITAVQEIEKVLKSGGWVAFGEPGRFGGGPKTMLLEKVLIEFHTHIGVDRFHIEKLPQLLAKSGFDPASIQTETYQLITCPNRPDVAADPVKRKLAEDGIDVYTSLFRHMREAMFEKAHPAVEKYCKTIEEFDQLIDDMQEEWENTTETSYLEFVVVTARKI